MVIVAEAGLNFLGLGFSPALPTLGQLIEAGRSHLFDQPRLFLAPGVVLFWLTAACALCGEGLAAADRRTAARG